MKLLVALSVAMLTLIAFSALQHGITTRQGPTIVPARVSGEVARAGTPTPPRASRSRHTEPPSRLDVLDWHALAQCESSNNPRAVSPSGRYRGLYQFDQETWESVGGQGDPSEASRQEQAYRALLLWRQRGTQPWPECGKRLSGRL